MDGDVTPGFLFPSHSRYIDPELVELLSHLLENQYHIRSGTAGGGIEKSEHGAGPDYVVSVDGDGWSSRRGCHEAQVLLPGQAGSLRVRGHATDLLFAPRGERLGSSPRWRKWRWRRWPRPWGGATVSRRERRPES